jgi:DNA gyrase subunit A
MGVKIINVGEEDKVVSLARINDDILDKEKNEEEEKKEKLTPEERAEARFNKIVEKIDREAAEKARAEENDFKEGEADTEE